MSQRRPSKRRRKSRNDNAKREWKSFALFIVIFISLFATILIIVSQQPSD